MNIVKIGIIPHKDAQKLHRDYDLKVSSTLDLKELAKKCGFKARGLGSMSKQVLNVFLKKKVLGRRRCIGDGKMKH